LKACAAQQTGTGDKQQAACAGRGIDAQRLRHDTCNPACASVAALLTCAATAATAAGRACGAGLLLLLLLLAQLLGRGFEADQPVHKGVAMPMHAHGAGHAARVLLRKRSEPSGGVVAGKAHRTRLLHQRVPPRAPISCQHAEVLARRRACVSWGAAMPAGASWRVTAAAPRRAVRVAWRWPAVVPRRQ
jgi:hypothetical protein